MKVYALLASAGHASRSRWQCSRVGRGQRTGFFRAARRRRQRPLYCDLTASAAPFENDLIHASLADDVVPGHTSRFTACSRPRTARPGGAPAGGRRPAPLSFRRPDRSRVAALAVHDPPSPGGDPRADLTAHLARTCLAFLRARRLYPSRSRAAPRHIGRRPPRSNRELGVRLDRQHSPKRSSPHLFGKPGGVPQIDHDLLKAAPRT